MLGIVLDASDLYGQGLLIRNKPGRAEEVGSLIRSCLEAGSIESRDLLKMLGRVQFADSHVMGRAGKLALADVRNWSKRHEVRIPITRALADAFEDAFIKGTSCSGAVRSILLAYEKCELQDATWTWFARVASDSNPSDEPSRGFFGGILKSLDAQRDSCFCPVSGGKLHEILGPIE
eukprot:s14470_g1.t1